MKIINKINISIFIVFGIFTIVNAQGTIDEKSLGLRKTDLYSEQSKTTGDMTKYSDKPAGTSTKIARAFQDAPPMIPHSVDGMLPIKINNNACTGCHAPEIAKAVGATPYPESHMTNLRPQHSYALKGENTSSEKLAHISIRKEKKLIGARFNCTQCHAPQSTATKAPKNTFKPVFSNKDGAKKSSWTGSRMTDYLNTVK